MHTDAASGASRELPANLAGGLQRIVAHLPVLYAELAEEIAAASPVCDLSGRCCRFREYGHTLFMSRPESELLFRQPFASDSPIDDASCPYQHGALCTAHERRPLGCRVYYCDPAYSGIGEQLSERYIRQLKDLHDLYGADWEYRPLLHFLREEKNSDRNESAEAPDRRAPIRNASQLPDPGAGVRESLSEGSGEPATEARSHDSA